MKQTTRIAIAIAAIATLAVPATAFAISGTSGPDVLWGTFQTNVIQGYAGNDKIHAGHDDNKVDQIFCGKGEDEVWAERRDILNKCEDVHFTSN